MGSRQENGLQGDFGEAWLEAVAAGSGLLHGRPTSLDLQKADVQLVYPGRASNTRYPTVLAQVKTTIGLRGPRNGAFSYDLDIATYEVLRQTDHVLRRILVVIGLPPEGDSVRLLPEGTLLAGKGAWVSLEGRPPSPNQSTQTVRLPEANTLDYGGLERMLRTYGVRGSTPAPDVTAWD